MDPSLPRTNDTIAFWLVLGIAFGTIAGLSAFLITYHEFAQHHMGPGQVMRHAAWSALIAGIFFFVGTLILGYALSHTIYGR
jgi:site-specific recombinase